MARIKTEEWKGTFPVCVCAWDAPWAERCGEMGLIGKVFSLLASGPELELQNP